MAKIMTWRDDWILRIDTLDDDHREIVDGLVEIALRFGEEAEDAVDSRAPASAHEDREESLFDLLDRFHELNRRHFQREEELLRTIEYARLADHRSEHALLMAEFTALVRELRQRGVKRLGQQDLENLKQWVVAHILGADRRFADHYFNICAGD